MLHPDLYGAFQIFSWEDEGGSNVFDALLKDDTLSLRPLQDVIAYTSPTSEEGNDVRPADLTPIMAWTDRIGSAAHSILTPPPSAYAQTSNTDAFVTTWNTTGIQYSPTLALGSIAFHIGVESGGQVTIDWGDGTSDTYNASGSVTHYYRHDDPTVPKSTAVEITGDLKRFYFHYSDPVTTSGSPELLLSVDQWGATQWSSMRDMFRGATHMKYMAADAPDLSANPSVHDMFRGTSAFDGDLSNWDVSSMTNLGYMFNRAYSFNGDISGWDVSKVQSMTYMFAEAGPFNADISGWDVSSVTNMAYMFYDTDSFNRDISGWNVSSVTQASAMFHIALSFNQDITDWDVSSVTSQHSMFYMLNAPLLNHNFGPWFIVLDDTFVGHGETLVTDISSKVGFDPGIDDYTITGTDAGDFTITNGQLVLNSAANYHSKSSYQITITANTTIVGQVSPNTEPSISANIRVQSPSQTAPTVTSITRYNPATQTTDSDTLQFRVLFSEAVTRVNSDDFELSPGSPTSGAITAVTGSGSQYYVTVGSSQAGTYNLDISDDNNIIDSSSNPLSSTTPTGDDQSYVVTATADTTPPALTLVGSPTVSISVGSTYADSGATCIDDTDGDITSQIVTSGSVDTGTAGTYILTFSCTDTASNSATQVSRTVFVVSSAPTVTSITRHNPATQTTDSNTLQFSVLFSEAVTGVSADDFELSPGSPTSAAYTYTSAPSLFVPYDVVKTDTITVTDSGTVTSVSVSVDITHDYIADLKVELVAPDGTTKVLHNRGGGSADDIVETYTPDFGSVSINGNWQLRLHDNYDGDEGTLNSWSLSFGEGSTPITAVTGSGSQYYVTVGSSQAGTYNLDVSDDNDIVDSSSNSLSSTTPTGDDQSYVVTATADTTPPVLTLVGSPTVAISVGSTYTDSGATCIDDTDGDITSQIVTSGSVDTSTAGTYAIVFSCTDAASNSATQVSRTVFVVNSAPTVTSITRYNPAAQTTDSDTLQFSVLFSEAVTGVSADDFELSPGSPTSAAYTYTSAPSLFVPYDVVKTDTITVTDSGTVTSVSVSVDITHDYIADLKVELVAPDGTTKVLHNRGGGSADDIVETYTPDFGSVSINGNWQLRLHDNYDGDEGTLNSWSLSFGEGSTPITAVTGSGSQYYVTVGSSQAGTYNLDVSDDNDIVDSSSNSLSSTTPTGDDQSYVVTATADTTPPVLTLVGSPTVAISVGSTYTDSGATCIDDTDGDITSQIVTSGSVDTSTADTYAIVFSCTDAADNSAAYVFRIIYVS